MDPRSVLHACLYKEVGDYLEKEDVVKFLKLCTCIKPAKKQQLQNMGDILDQLQKQGVIGIGNYDVLLQILGQLEQKELQDNIHVKAEEIANLNPREQVEDTETLSSHASGIKRKVEDAVNEKKVKILKDNPEDLDYSKDKKGLVLIINNMEFRSQSYREGSEVDEKNIKKLFEEVLPGQYVVHSGENCSLSQLKCVLDQAKKELEKNIYDQFFCFVLSHGGEKGILTYDGEFLSQSDIIDYFKADKLKVMTSHPKVFIFQACRGGVAQAGVQIDDPSIRVQTKAEDFVEVDYMSPVIPVDANIVTGYSTTKGFYSFRNIFNGSWYIENICSVFGAYRNEHLLDLLTRVHQRVSSKETTLKGKIVAKQMPSFDSTFTKKMYLH